MLGHILRKSAGPEFRKAQKCASWLNSNGLSYPQTHQRGYYRVSDSRRTFADSFRRQSEGIRPCPEVSTYAHVRGATIRSPDRLQKASAQRRGLMEADEPDTLIARLQQYNRRKTACASEKRLGSRNTRALRHLDMSVSA